MQWWPRPSRRARRRDRSTRTYGGVHWSGSRSKCNNCTYSERHRTSSRGVRGASTSHPRELWSASSQFPQLVQFLHRWCAASHQVPRCTLRHRRLYSAPRQLLLNFAGVARVVESFTFAPTVIAAPPALAVFTATSLAASYIASALAVYGRSR